MRLIEIGRAFFSISWTASAIELVAPCGTLMSGGAPSESWSDLDPVILARSNRVSQGGPINTLFPCAGISASLYSISS